MLLYQVNGWKMGEKKSTELHSLFYQRSYIVLKQTSKQAKSFGVFLNWKAVLSWRASLNCEQNRGEKKDRKLPESKWRVLLKGEKQRRAAYGSPDFCVKQMMVASHRHPTLEWADTIILPNHDPGFCLLCLYALAKQIHHLSIYLDSQLGRQWASTVKVASRFSMGRPRLRDTGSLRGFSGHLNVKLLQPWNSVGEAAMTLLVFWLLSL